MQHPGVKIFVRRQDRIVIESELARIVMQSINQFDSSPQRSLVVRMCDYAVDKYLKFAQENFCQGFINYYDGFDQNCEKAKTDKIDLDHNIKVLPFKIIPKRRRSQEKRKFFEPVAEVKMEPMRDEYYCKKLR